MLGRGWGGLLLVALSLGLPLLTAKSLKVGVLGVDAFLGPFFGGFGGFGGLLFPDWRCSRDCGCRP